MNDQPDDTTEVTPTPDDERSALIDWNLAQWRRAAIVSSSLFLITLVLLGWQLADGNDGHGDHKFNGRGGPGMMQGQGGPGGQPGQGHFDGSFEGGPPQAGDPQQFQDGQGPRSGSRQGNGPTN